MFKITNLTLKNLRPSRPSAQNCHALLCKGVKNFTQAHFIKIGYHNL